MEQFPSESVAAELDTAVSAEPGSFIVFDSMVFHRAGENRSGRPRRAVNQVFSVPIIAQQISLPDALNGRYADDPALARLFGYDVTPAQSVTAWRERRLARQRRSDVKILFVLKQKKNVETFAGTIRVLTERGHSVALAVQEHSDTRADQYRDWIEPATPKPGKGGPGFSLVRCPAHRTDRWADVAWLLRSLRDCVHYQQPGMRNATKLQARSVQKLREELRIEADNESVAKACADCRSRKSGASTRCSRWPSGSCRSIRCTSRSCASRRRM